MSCSTFFEVRKSENISLLCKALILSFSLFLSSNMRAQDSIVTLGDNVAIDLVWVEGGSFIMGNNETPKGVKLTYEESSPEHRVTVDGFFIGRFEVTQGQWKAVMGDNPSRFAGNDSLPVETVSWEEAQQFVTLLSQMTGKRFRLPYEAEWEYAARGGNKGRGLPYAGFVRATLDTSCWYCVNSKGCTHTVGSRMPNELGLFDICGNVAEWCQDWVDAYTAEEAVNPHGPREGEHKVLRGGHYSSTSATCTVYDRSWYIPTGKNETFGLRVVMEPSTAEEVIPEPAVKKEIKEELQKKEMPKELNKRELPKKDSLKKEASRKGRKQDSKSPKLDLKHQNQ